MQWRPNYRATQLFHLAIALSCQSCLSFISHMPCSSPLHVKSHLNPQYCCPRGTSAISGNVAAAFTVAHEILHPSPPFRRPNALTSVPRSTTTVPVPLILQGIPAPSVVSRPTSFVASSAWSIQPPFTEPDRTDQPHCRALVCFLVLASQISSPSRGPGMCAPGWLAAVLAAVGVGASSTEAGASLPFQDEMSQWDDSPLTIDESFGSTSSAWHSSAACAIGDTARDLGRLPVPNTGGGVVGSEVEVSRPYQLRRVFWTHRRSLLQFFR